MAFRIGPDKIGALSHNAGTLTLAPSLVTVGGQQIYTGTLSRAIASDVTLAANTLYMVYVVIASGVTSLRVSTNVNSAGPAGFSRWALVGAFMSSGAITPAYAYSVNIIGTPVYQVQAIYQAVSTSVGAGAVINYANMIRDTGSNVTTGVSWRFIAPLAGYYSVAATISAASAGTAGASVFNIYKGGVQDCVLRQSDVGSGSFSGAASIFLNASEYIDFRLGTAFGSASSSSGINSQAAVLLERANILTPLQDM